MANNGDVGLEKMATWVLKSPWILLALKCRNHVKANLCSILVLAGSARGHYTLSGLMTK